MEPLKDPIRALLTEMRSDEYVRFKYGKQIDQALRTLDARASVDAQVLEARLVELLELVRGKKGGGATAAGSKSKRTPSKAKESAHAHV